MNDTSGNSPFPVADEADPPLWRFSLSFYRRPGVADTCLALQERHGVDVNILLCALWLASCGISLSKNELAWLDDSIRPWRQMAVQPLRAIRHALRDEKPLPDQQAVEALRSGIKTLELQAEKLQQFELARLAQSLTPARQTDPLPAAARANLEACQLMLGCAFSRDAQETLLAALQDELREQSGQENTDDYKHP